MSRIADYLEDNMMACGYKQNFGFECPGCGLQRSLVDLLNGNIVDSFHQYPATIPMIFMLVFLIFHLIFKFQKGAKILLYTFILNSTIIVINYLFKILDVSNRGYLCDKC